MIKRTNKKYKFNPIGKNKKKYLSFPNPNKWIKQTINFNFNGLNKSNSNLTEFNNYNKNYDKKHNKLYWKCNL